MQRVLDEFKQGCHRSKIFYGPDRPDIRPDNFGAVALTFCLKFNEKTLSRTQLIIKKR